MTRPGEEDFESENDTDLDDDFDEDFGTLPPPAAPVFAAGDLPEGFRSGFACFVGRAWMAPFDWPEFWNPKVRAADCMNPQAARFVLPIAFLRSRMVMAGHSRAEILAALRAAFEQGQLPDLERGAMDYVMSPSAYLTDEGDHNLPHVMFYAAGADATDWGAGMAGSPVGAAPYWFFSPEEPSRMDGLPPIHVYLVVVGNWSDGTPAGKHED